MNKDYVCKQNNYNQLSTRVTVVESNYMYVFFEVLFCREEIDTYRKTQNIYTLAKKLTN